MAKVTELFLEYAAMDTQADDSSDTFLSTNIQHPLKSSHVNFA